MSALSGNKSGTGVPRLRANAAVARLGEQQRILEEVAQRNKQAAEQLNKALKDALSKLPPPSLE
jgi:hypothetical protein